MPETRDSRPPQSDMQDFRRPKSHASPGVHENKSPWLNGSMSIEATAGSGADILRVRSALKGLNIDSSSLFRPPTLADISFALVAGLCFSSCEPGLSLPSLLFSLALSSNAATPLCHASPQLPDFPTPWFSSRPPSAYTYHRRLGLFFTPETVRRLAPFVHSSISFNLTPSPAALPSLPSLSSLFLLTTPGRASFSHYASSHATSRKLRRSHSSQSGWLTTYRRSCYRQHVDAEIPSQLPLYKYFNQHNPSIPTKY
ncbi:hypothetical protein E4U55_003052 [Claviceps digitariae]|nr:hypothetical protein E4U55_003052 [Claviceps digitariae]